MLLHLVALVSGYFVSTRGCVPPEPVLSSFVDVSAKIPSGISTGNLADLGSFDQCLALDKTHNGARYKGKYCLIKVSLPAEILYTRNSINQCLLKESEILSNRTNVESQACATTPNRISATNKFDLILGWCIPHSCSIEDTADYMREVLVSLSLLPSEYTENITVSPFLGGHCQTTEQLATESATWSTAEVFAIAFLSVIGCIMVLSTSYDIYLHYSNRKPAHVILTAFSLKTNVERLLAISPSNSDPLLCLQGMRYTRMMWILFENRYALARGEPFVHFSDLRNFQAENMYIMGADQSADTLFFITGLYVAYEFHNAHADGKPFNVIHFWLRKYVKLAPLMVVVVLTYATILNRFGSGPFWPVVLTPMKENCQQNWWATLLYVQNYYHIDNICIGQSWYFAVDNQMFFLAPLILIPQLKWPKYTLYAAVVLFIGSILSPLLTSFYYDLLSPANPNYLPTHFFPTHIRFGAWFMGLVFGFILHKLKGTAYKLHPVTVAFGWIVSFTLLLLTVFLPNALMYEHDPITNAFFNGMHRQVWVFGLAWLVYACAHGYGGLINSILSCPVFQSLGRLSYIMYVIHVSQQYLMTAESRTTIYYSDFDTFYKFCSDLFFTTAISAVLYLAFEAPMVVIDKLIFDREQNKTKKSELPVPWNDGVIVVSRINTGFENDI